MCALSQAVDELTAAAHALTRACHCRVEAISVVLHEAFNVSLGEPVPGELAALLEKVDVAH
ncbi:hypothetical protein [Sphingomonas profundi]|uniref:hypothetical protein n=1 Tax=Alterirhizorhabdus profundi TaxID=2681549 RepID=UPI0012E6FA54|nr:hypothetical protein [Sphingomonas profundi]